ncbi:MAG: hypothetical protein M1519_02855 [Actinobacteria bacterium]|jgi:F-type H+-transporting ATPase subunit epsilon|nr:hypothetical protein [Actinomycetota bacterium]
MVNTYAVQVATPDNLLYEGEAQMMVVRTGEGEAAFLAQHARLVATLEPGQIRIVLEDGSEKVADLEGGFVHVHDNQVVVMASGGRLIEDRP